MYLLPGKTAGAGQASAPSDQINIIEACGRRIDVAVAQNDLPHHHARQSGPGPVAHPASRSMTFPSPSVTVMIRPAAEVLMKPPPEMGKGVRWPKQARHTSQMERLRMRGEELAVAAGRGARTAFQHVLSASTATYI